MLSSSSAAAAPPDIDTSAKPQGHVPRAADDDFAIPHVKCSRHRVVVVALLVGVAAAAALAATTHNGSSSVVSATTAAHSALLFPPQLQKNSAPDARGDPLNDSRTIGHATPAAALAVFSVPVYACEACAVDLVRNVLGFAPGCAVVVHLNAIMARGPRCALALSRAAVAAPRGQLLSKQPLPTEACTRHTTSSLGLWRR